VFISKRQCGYGINIVGVGSPCCKNDYHGAKHLFVCDVIPLNSCVFRYTRDYSQDTYLRGTPTPFSIDLSLLVQFTINNKSCMLAAITLIIGLAYASADAPPAMEVPCTCPRPVLHTHAVSLPPE